MPGPDSANLLQILICFIGISFEVQSGSNFDEQDGGDGGTV